MHGAVHAEIAVVTANGAGRFPRIELHGVESLAGESGFRRSHPDLSQNLKDRYFFAASKSAASCSGGVEQPASDSPAGDGQRLCGRVAGSQQRSFLTPMKIMRSRDCGTPKYIAFISLAETL